MIAKEGPGSDVTISTAGFPNVSLVAALSPAREFAFERVPPGAYRAVLHDRLSSVSGGTQLLVTNRDVEDVRVFTIPGLTLSGRVVTNTGAYAGEKAQLLLTGVTPEGPHFTTGPLSADGEFALRDLRPGKYRAQIYPQPGSVIRSVRVGNKTFEGSAFEIGYAGGEPTTIGIGAGSEISGTVEDPNFTGGPFRGTVSIVTFPTVDAVAPVLKTAALRADGTFAIGALEPGGYRVCAWREESGAFLPVLAAQAYQQRLDSACAKVTLKTDSAESVRARQMSVSAFR